MNKAFYVWCLIFLLFGNEGFSQQGIDLQMVTPPPPNISAIDKFGLMPVDNFTGVPSISIPVFTIKDGTLTLPISLQYHAGGLKVHEESSDVGLGWALNASGSITCITRGRPDFVGGFADTHSQVPDPPSVQMTTKNPAYSLTNWYYQWKNDADVLVSGSLGSFIFSGLTLYKNGVLKQYYNNFSIGYDGQAPDFASDLYIMTIGDKSYRFIFDNDFKPVVLGDGALKIELIYNGNYPDWKVTDENGTVYYFDQRQFSYSNNFYPATSGTAPQLSSWHLTKIESATYGKIDILYSHSANTYESPVPSFSETYLVGNTSAHTQQEFDKVGISYTMYEKTNIDEIQFSTGRVKFVYDPTRLDLKGGQRLSSIEVYNNSKLIKKMDLDNDHYFTSVLGYGFSNQAFNLSSFSSDNITKRLKLVGVKEVDVTDFSKYKKYSLGYEENINLPSKLSLAIDHWGYYNKAENGQLLPPATIYLSTEVNPRTFTGANREASPEGMPANVLTSITYPTGGKSKFTYEPNQYPTTETVVTYKDEYSGMFKAAGSSTINTSGFVDANGNFTVGQEWVGKKLEIVTSLTNPTYPNNYDMDMIIKKNGLFVARISLVPNYSINLSIDSSVVLEAGTYNISYEASTNFFNSFEIRRQVYIVRASYTTEEVPKTAYIGGLRTSKIVSYDPLSGKNSSRIFSYSNLTTDNIPIYESAEGYDAQPDGTGNRFKYRYGQSIYPFSDGRMSPYAGYQNVEVKDVDENGKDNGVTEYNYAIGGSININAMARYNPSAYQAAICNPVMAQIPDIASGFRGKLMKEKVYKSTSDGKILVTSTNYIYSWDNSITIWQMLFNQGLSWFTGPNGEQTFAIYAHQFAIPVSRNQLKSKEVVMYDPIGNPTMSQLEEYTYDNTNNHFQLIKKSTKNSKDETVNYYYKFPTDYGDLTTASNLDIESQGIQLLQQKHILLPIESYRENVVGEVKKYSDGVLKIYNANLPTPKSILALELNYPLSSFTSSTVINGIFTKNNFYTNRINFTKYDDKGRLLEQQRANNIRESYFWGYNGAYPVAKIIGSSYDVARQFVDLGILNDVTKSNADLRNELNKLRLNLPQALVTTYTYDPNIGLTSETNPQGRSSYYEYDGLGRLFIIRDHESNIIKRIEYKYVNQNP